MTHRPEQLILTLLGEFILDRRPEPIPTSVFVNILGSFDIPESTVRSTLRRMTQRDLLAVSRSGRTVAFQLTSRSLSVLREADARVRGETPFRSLGTGWTLVSFSMPESQRDARHHLRGALTWAGFGLLRDGLWIAPGRIDVTQELTTTRMPLAGAAISVFTVTEFEELGDMDVVATAWDLRRVMLAHETFTERWGGRVESSDPLHQIIELVADWLDVLRVDPRLPDSVLPEPWPANTTATAFRDAYAALHPDAQLAFDTLVGG